MRANMCVYEKFWFDSRFDKRRMRGLKTEVLWRKLMSEQPISTHAQISFPNTSLSNFIGHESCISISSVLMSYSFRCNYNFTLNDFKEALED